MTTKLFLIFLISCSLTIGQSPSDALKKLQNKFNSISNFTASFSQNPGKISGKFSYKKKNKFIVEFKNQTIVSDGQTIWNNDKRFNRVVINRFTDDPTSFSLERFIFDYPPLCKVKIVRDETSTPGEVVLEYIPKDQDLEFKSVKMWLNSDWLISKLEVVDRGDIRYLFQFSDIKINQDLPDLKFIYYPPKGIQIIDLR